MSTAVRTGTHARRSTLPEDLTSFIGRKRELAEAEHLLSLSRLVTLTGVGGVGKTRLALNAARDLSRAFRDGVYLVELAGLEDPGLVPSTFADALGIVAIPVTDRSDPEAWLANDLGDRQTLIILDNCEHLLEACVRLCSHVLAAAAQTRILVTSRQALGITGEHVLRVPPLTADSDAVRLFAERAAAVVSGFAVNEANRDAVVRLCRALDGIPLAIELAAVNMRSLSVEQIIERLDDRYRLLARGSRAAQPRQQTLKALIDWSYALLSETEQALWSRLSVFAGGVDLAAAEGVCAGDGIEPEDVLNLVDALVEKSILIREEEDGTARYRLLETLREYGRAKLDAQGAEEVHRVRQDHRDYFALMADRARADWFSPRQRRWISWIRTEHANIRAALEYAVTVSGEAASGLRMALALRNHWVGAGLLDEGRHWLDRALSSYTAEVQDRGRQATDELYIRALCLDASLALAQSDVAGAVSRLELADGKAGQARGYADQAWGLAEMFRGDTAAARIRLLSSLEAHRADDDLAGTAMDLLLLGGAAALGGDHAHAVADFQEVVALCDAHGEVWCRSHAQWSMGIEKWRLGDAAGGLELQRSALRLKRDLADWVGVALCLEAIAWIHAADGEGRRATVLLGGARPIWRTTGASLFSNLAGDHDQCATTAAQALGEAEFEAVMAEGAGMTRDDAIAYALDEEPVRHAASTTGFTDEAALLTSREREIADLIAEGLSNREIAARLVIAQRTAEGHVAQILHKLNFTSRAQVAVWVVERRGPHTD